MYLYHMIHIIVQWTIFIVISICRYNHHRLNIQGVSPIFLGYYSLFYFYFFKKKWYENSYKYAIRI